MAKDIGSYFLEQGQPIVPKAKPKQYTIAKEKSQTEEALDILNTKAAATMLSPRTYVNLVGQTARKAYDQQDISASDYYDIVMPLFGEKGEMITEKIRQYDAELDRYADGGRVNFDKGNRNPGFKGERYSFPKGKDNPGVRENIEKINKEKRIIFDEKKLRAKELLEEGYSKAKASQIINVEYGGTRNPQSGAAKYVTEAASELEKTGFKIPHGNINPDSTSKADAAKKRTNVTKKTKQAERRFMETKKDMGLGKTFENAHTANIFQAKALGAEYPVDALAPQTVKQNQVYAEKLNDELKPFYKEQLKLKRAFDKNPTKELSKLIDINNTAIQNLVASGGKQGKKAANLLRGWNLDVRTGKPYLPMGGFNPLKSVDRGMTDKTLQSLKAKTPDDVVARKNYEELLKEKAGKYGKFAKAIARPVFRAAAPFIPFVGTAGMVMGGADVAKASEFTQKPDELAAAYLLGPEGAKGLASLKNKVRGKLDEFEEFVP